MKNIFNIFFLSICGFVLSGCVGIHTYNKTDKISRQCEGFTDYCWASIEKRVGIHTSDAPFREPPSKKDVIQKFGEPSQIVEPSLRNNHETWSYRDGLAWRGIWLIPIPIPLMLPTGYDHLEFSFEEDKVISYSTEHAAGKFCGIVIFVPWCEW